jgi:hypothetical protein
MTAVRGRALLRPLLPGPAPRRKRTHTHAHTRAHAKH